MAIADFGEKIGGAKKDLWKLRGIIASDLSDMNDAEQDKYVRKDNIWKKPDYEKMVSVGIPVEVVYFIKLMRDSLPTRPATVTGREVYVDFVGAFRDKVMSLRTLEEVETFFNDYLTQYFVNPESRCLELRPEAYGCITNKMVRTAYSMKSGLGKSRLRREIEKKQFCYSKEDKLLIPYTFLFFDKSNAKFVNEERFANTSQGKPVMEYRVGHGKHFFYPADEDWTDPDKWENGTYFVIKGNRLAGRNFATKEDARNWALEKAKVDSSAAGSVKEKRSRKKGFVPKQLESVTRKGEDLRNGKNIIGDDFLTVFGFKGGEFGNWMDDKDRQASLNFAYEGLLDMCKAIGISPKDVSLGGRLSIAFGARGSGSALAHYEPLREVINLTKMKGAGSLAHEWGHALDDIIGKKIGLGGMMSERSSREKDCPESFRKLMRSMMRKEVCDETSLKFQMEEAELMENRLRTQAKSYFKVSDLSSSDAATLEALISKLVEAGKVKGDEAVPLEAILDGSGCEEIDALSDFRKKVTGHVITKEARSELGRILNSYAARYKRIGEKCSVITDYYRGSIKFDELFAKAGHGYYQSPIEMLARAFACYVKDKLEEMGCHNDYLCGHADMGAVTYQDAGGNERTACAVPQGEERRIINRNFDRFFEEMKSIGLLHEYEAPAREYSGPNTIFDLL